MSSPTLPVTHHRSFSPRSPPRPTRIPSDVLKESILANSHSGWAAATIASPLKIKQQQQQQSTSDDESSPPSQLRKHATGPPVVARRTSNSFKHVRNGSLVSKSPFKSPTLGSESEENTPLRPLGAKFKPPPQWQSGGYKVLSPTSRPSKIPGGALRKASPASKRGSPSAAARRASLEKKKKLLNNENFQKALALEAAALGGTQAGLGITAPTEHPLGFSRRKSNGLQGLAQAEYVSKSPFVSTRNHNSATSSPSLDSSATPSPQTTHDTDFEEPATPVIAEDTVHVEVQEPSAEQSTPSRLTSFLPVSPATKHLQNASVSSRPLPSSPRSRGTATSLPIDSAQETSPSPPRHSTNLTNNTNMSTPTKSSLKTKRRIRGPRSPSDHSPENKMQRTNSGRVRRYGSLRRTHERRKTVTFDERCDVLEFEVDDGEEGGEDWETTEDEEMYGYDKGAHVDHLEHGSNDGDSEDGEGYDGHQHQVSEVDAIHGLVNSILEDEMAGFRDERDSVDGDRSMDSRREADSNRSIDFNEANTSLDFQEANTSLDFHPANSSLDFHPANTSLDFHEGDSFDLSMQASYPHLMSNGRQSYPIEEEDEDGLSTENEKASPAPRRNDDRSTKRPNSYASSNISSRGESSASLPLTSLESIGQIHDASRVDVVVTAATTIPAPGNQQNLPHVPEASPFLINGLGPDFGSGSTLSSLTRSESSASLSGRSSPRISREDVKKRMMQQRLGRSAMQREMEGEETEDDDDEVLTSAVDSQDRALPPIPPSSSSERVLTIAMTATQSHDTILQSTKRQDDVDPARPTLGERSITTDGNLPSGATAFGVPFDLNRPGASIGDVKSALDRLLIGVENGFMDERTEPPPGSPHSRPTSFVGDSMEKVLELTKSNHDGHQAVQLHQLETFHSLEALHVSTASGATHTPRTESSSGGSSAPSTGLQVPRATTTGLTRVKSGKQVIREHEAAIIAKRRELKQRNGSGSSGGSGRPNKRRSLSTGDAEGIRYERRPAMDDDPDLLDVPCAEEVDIPFSDSVERELKKLNNEKVPTYRLREHDKTIYASADDKVAHMGRAGDVDSGKAWRTMRRPSDMNEYARQIREYRSQEKPGKAHGKVFVKVLGLKAINVPLPAQPTVFNLTLNNGIHCVATPDCRLGKECRIDQEFELIEHGQLEFTLKVTVRKDPHIIAQMQAAAPRPPPPPPPIVTIPTPLPTKSGGLFGLFSTPSKKSKTHKRASTQPETIVHHQQQQQSQLPRVVPENLAKYLKPDGTLGHAFISFKDVARRCDTRLFETTYPVMGQANDERSRGKSSTGPGSRQMGELVLQLFRLPPLPGIKADQLPQSLEECHRGLRHIAWHKVMYHEGTLTQMGGDCSTWRRRHIKVIGANLVAHSDVTNKPTATIELKKATAVVDDQDMTNDPTSPGKDGEDSVHVERSFRLLFPNEVEIAFFTDTDEEKSRWLDILRALIGRIPPNPLWAELVWQRQEEMTSAAGRSPSNASSAVPTP